MSEMQKKNYKVRLTGLEVNQALTDPSFTTGVFEFVNRLPFREFKDKNQQFLYERGRQFAAYLTHQGYDANIIKSNTAWLDKELARAVNMKDII